MASNSKKAKNTPLMLIVILIVSAILFGVFFTVASKFFQTETYYVLNQDVPTRTQVTPEMLDPVTTSEGTAPKAAIGLSDVQTGNVYTQYPLISGDILTMSNVGKQQDISVGVPDNWVITTISVSADNAVGGRITRGAYFDVMVTTNSGSFYPFVNVLTLDTTVDMDNASSADAADTDEAHAGQTTQYTVGMSPEDAGKLQQVMKKYGSNGDLKLVLSPRANEYQKPALADYSNKFSYDESGSSVTPIWPGKSDKGEITDYTFTPVERDAFGRPVAAPENCSVGNAKVSGDDCKTPDTKDTSNADSSATPSAEPSTEPNN